MAWRANGSVYSQLRVDTYASMACVMASIPVWAVSFFGMVSARAGSTIATSGVMLKSARGYLIPLL